MAHNTLPPGATIGILGGGQLGRLLAIAAAKLGFKTFLYAPDDDSPAFHVSDRSLKASYSDRESLEEFAKACDVVTFEFENVPAETLHIVSDHCQVSPSARAAAIAQDRIAERRFLTGAGLPVAPHRFIQTEADLSEAATFLAASEGGLLKRARDGYDGKGQKRVATADDLGRAYAEFASPCVLEAMLRFEREISVIAVRSAGGEVRCYDVPENRHESGILRTSRVPVEVPEGVQLQAQRIARGIAEALDYIGVLGVELFVMPDEGQHRLVVNEIAPRVHNTGHWTLDACLISQFENHIRAIAGWPLGSTARHSDATMTNLIGDDVLAWETLAAREPDTALYLYGKSEIRAGRKLGHFTVISKRQNV